jgi:hypothetical protein
LPFSYFKSSHYESLQKTASDFSKNAKQAWALLSKTPCYLSIIVTCNLNEDNISANRNAQLNHFLFLLK